MKANANSQPRNPTRLDISTALRQIGMRKLAPSLEEEAELGHAIYADDITLWALKGSIGERQDVP
ncbi:hypothetical protein HPB50_005431 [Hyalomma asiaticum]|uniref:Uncharacterized protein n=1 Tax=Hyalomma asiaticum TaxID=266040 RepID=A0ACB7SAI1_HYAAI|nr:hypothetical protein HPB50_005431 [Hyalomma asiaticum]